MKGLTERQYKVLVRVPDNTFVRPMDLGGRDGSHHSNTLRLLAGKGYVEIGGYQSWSRRVNRYRRTPEGRQAVEKFEKAKGRQSPTQQ